MSYKLAISRLSVIGNSFFNLLCMMFCIQLFAHLIINAESEFRSRASFCVLIADRAHFQELWFGRNSMPFGSDSYSSENERITFLFVRRKDPLKLEFREHLLLLNEQQKAAIAWTFNYFCKLSAGQPYKCFLICLW